MRDEFDNSYEDGTEEHPVVVDYWQERRWREIDEKQRKEQKAEETKTLKKNILKTVAIVGIVVIVLFLIGNCFNHRELKPKFCSLCHGTGTYHNHTCYRCFGDGIEYYYDE